MKFHKLALYLSYVCCLAYYNTNQIGQYYYNTNLIGQYSVDFIYQKFIDFVAWKEYF
jgi:hypothetical protein